MKVLTRDGMGNAIHSLDVLYSNSTTLLHDLYSDTTRATLNYDVGGGDQDDQPLRPKPSTRARARTMAQPTPAAGHSLPQPLPFSPSSLPPLPSLSSSASASDSPPPSSKQLSFGIGTTALSPLLSFHPPSAWQLDATDTAVWHLVNATSGASVVHAFAGSEWALRGTVQKLVTAGGGGGGPLSTEGALNVDNSVRQATATRDDGDIVAAEGLGEGWHRAIWDLPPGFKGAMSVYGAVGRVNVITDA